MWVQTLNSLLNLQNVNMQSQTLFPALEVLSLIGNIGRDLHDSQHYWSVHLLASWQGEVDDDLDDRINLKAHNGQASDSHNTGFIFIETLREQEAVVAWPKMFEEHTIVHEIGHQGGASHSDGGIMGAPMSFGEPGIGGRFTGVSIKKFREGTKF